MGGGSRGVNLTVRRKEEVVEQVKQVEVVEVRRRNWREVEREMDERLCLVDLQYRDCHILDSTQGCEKYIFCSSDAPCAFQKWLKVV